MRISEVHDTMYEGQFAYTVQIDGAESNILAASDISPWLVKPAADHVKFRTFRTAGCQYWRISADDLRKVARVLDADLEAVVTEWQQQHNCEKDCGNMPCKI